MVTMDKKPEFQIGDISTIAIVFVVAGIVIAFGLSVLADIKGDFVANSTEANATGEAIDGVSNMAEKLPLLATVVIAAIIIGVVVAYFGRGK